MSVTESETTTAGHGFSSIDRDCIQAIRALSIDAVEAARSGHPGLPLGAAPMGYVLWHRHLRHDPAAPDWPDRDRFVLSAGHGSMLQYALMHLCGFADVTTDELKRFRQWGSRTPGHPECFVTAGVEATTGPLGQGAGNVVGMAIAERWLAEHFNRPDHVVVDHVTYALVSDGDVMEGVFAEAASLAGHLQLGKLICLYDANDVSLDGPNSLTFGEDVAARYEAYGWHVQTVADGDTDLAALDRALAAARTETTRPSLIVVKTTIGYGSPNKSGTSAAHGAPLGPDEAALTKAALGWTHAPFVVPDAVRAHFAARNERIAAARADWQRRHEAWASAHPALAAEWEACRAGRLPDGWDAGLPTWQADEALATRVAGGKALEAIASAVPWLIGGDADLSCSTKTTIGASGSFGGQRGADGRNLHFGVREHAMGAIANGMAYHGGVRPYTATFFVFADYMRPALRLAAMNGLPVVHVFTHDSIGVGEDGPTHQPIEHLMSLRVVPNLHVVRPADANEAAQAWVYAMARTGGPTALVLSRQGLPCVDRTTHGGADGLHRGAYVLAGTEGTPDAILIATGSEVTLALEARERLASRGLDARVVSMPCWEAFEAQDASYRDEVLPPSVTARVSVEAGVTLGWERWLGPRGRAFGLDRFGASAPGEVVFEQLGFTAENVAKALEEIVKG